MEGPASVPYNEIELLCKMTNVRFEVYLPAESLQMVIEQLNTFGYKSRYNRRNK